MTQGLRESSKIWQAYDGAVKVWMLPYKRMGLIEACQTLIGDDGKLPQEKGHFAVMDWVLVDVEIASNAPSVWRMLKTYMQRRKPYDLKSNWAIFSELGSEELLDELNIAFEATRETLLSSSWYVEHEAADDTDPKP